ncbi:MAG: molybdopterin-synthase adenylyltransferase MoeB [Lachnospiraceae bacterium]|nr:molybdopterin-synthase adenylyltransferase MoeB [Lachnospiraceae bacterium]
MKLTLDEVGNLDKDRLCYLDMRGKIAYSHGHIPDALCFDTEHFEESVEKIPRDRIYIVYCSIGEKSMNVAEKLRKKGYEAYSLEAGFAAWLRANVSENERYERQMILPEVGLEGQEKLKNARVLVIGAGGLGSPAALYLAGAGIGTIGIADADTVSLSNLHRQILHTMAELGQNKSESAKTNLQKLNDSVRIVTYPYHITPENIDEIISNYDFIIDGVDNFETKFLINDACVIRKKPFCHAGILRFQGQIMTYVPGKGPCYRCIFEEIPEQGSIPNCSQAGIIGAVAGVIGSIQALEAIKYILSAGELLTAKMYVFDGLTLKSRIIKFPYPSESCRVCGPEKNIVDVRLNRKEYAPAGCQ